MHENNQSNNNNTLNIRGHSNPINYQDNNMYDHHPYMNSNLNTMNNQPNMMYNQPNMGNNQPNMMYNQPNMGNNQPNMMYNQPNMGNNQPNMMYNQPNMGNNQPNMMHNQPNMMYHNMPYIPKKDFWLLTIWKAFYPCLAYIGIQFISAMVIFSIFLTFSLKKLSFSHDLASNNANLFDMGSGFILISMFLSALVSIPLLLFFYNNDRKRYFNGVKEKKIQPKYHYLYIIMASLGLSSIAGILALLIQSWTFHSDYAETEQIFQYGGIMFQFITLAILVPIAEELIFRGLAYKRLRRCFSVSVSAVITSIAFGLIHGNLVQGIPAILMGLGMVYLYETYKNLYVPIIFHILNNSLYVIFNHIPFSNTWQFNMIWNIWGIGMGIIGFILIQKYFKDKGSVQA